MAPNEYEKGLRVLDIEHGLRGIQSTGLIEAELANTLLLGKATNLALHLRGLNVVPAEPLRYMAGEIGVRGTELGPVLHELEEIGWVRIVETGGKIKRVEVLVPALRDGFETIGERWDDLGPTEIEEASVAVLADAIARPFGYVDLEDRLGLDAKLAGVVLEIGDTGTYLSVHRLDDGEKVVHSPLYGDNNPEKAYELVKKYGDDRILKVLDAVRERQGIPVKMLKDDRLLRDAKLAGLFLVPSVKEQQFVFTPQQGSQPHETVVLDKARAILSCVRYGQHFADITKIRYPRAIISALIDRKTLEPHSEHAEQYGLLVKKGIGLVEKVGSRYRFRVMETEDNMQALRTAAELLEAGAGVSQAIDDRVRMQVLNPAGTYTTPVVERAKLNRNVQLGKESNAQTLAVISEIIRGARSA